MAEGLLLTHIAVVTAAEDLPSWDTRGCKVGLGDSASALAFDRLVASPALVDGADSTSLSLRFFPLTVGPEESAPAFAFISGLAFTSLAVIPE